MGANASTSANGGNRQSGAPLDHYQGTPLPLPPLPRSPLIRSLPFIVLGIEQSASSLEIKKAYVHSLPYSHQVSLNFEREWGRFRSLALREHPDKNPNDIEGATLRFSRIQAAYEVLSDEQERAWYDDHQEEILNPSSSSNNSSESFLLSNLRMRADEGGDNSERSGL